jgi:hypothetical protein
MISTYYREGAAQRALKKFGRFARKVNNKGEKVR